MLKRQNGHAFLVSENAQICVGELLRLQDGNIILRVKKPSKDVYDDIYITHLVILLLTDISMIPMEAA